MNPSNEYRQNEQGLTIIFRMDWEGWANLKHQISQREFGVFS